MHVCVRCTHLHSLTLDSDLAGQSVDINPDELCREGGDGVLLTVDNVEEYVHLLPRVILSESIKPQLEAFRSGFRCQALACRSVLAVSVPAECLLWVLCRTSLALGWRPCVDP